MGTSGDTPEVPEVPEIDEKRERAYSLHLRGRSYRAIAVELSVDKDTVQRWVKAVAAASAPRRKQAIQQAQRDAVARFREIQSAAWSLYEAKDDTSALNTALNAEREIAKLRGLYDVADDSDRGSVTILISKRGDVRMRASEIVESEASDGES